MNQLRHDRKEWTNIFDSRTTLFQKFIRGWIGIGGVDFKLIEKRCEKVN